MITMSYVLLRCSHGVDNIEILHRCELTNSQQVAEIIVQQPAVGS